MTTRAAGIGELPRAETGASRCHGQGRDVLPHRGHGLVVAHHRLIPELPVRFLDRYDEIRAGKVDRLALREVAKAEGPASTLIGPVSDLESQLQEIWAAALGVQPVAAALALATGRSVKVTLSRTTDFEVCRSRHPSRTTMRIGARADVKAPFDWSDIGSWAALREVSDNNAGDNVAFGPVIHIDSVANLVHAPDCHVALLGVDNLAVVYTGDVLLVASLDRSQDIKLLRERLKDSGLEDLL